MAINKDEHVNLEYWIGKRKVETFYDIPRGVATNLKKKLARTTHQVGTFKIKRR